MRHRFLAILLILCASLAFIFGNATVRGFCVELTYPFQRVFAWVNTQVGTRLSAAWRGLCDGPARNNAEIEIDRLRIMLQNTERIAQENSALRQTLAWREQFPFQVIAAQVWSHGGGLGVWPRLQLSCGALQGIKPGDIVLVPDGLVGRIADTVTAHTSEVILLSDPGCHVAAEVPGGVKGIVQGTQGADFATSSDDTLLYSIQPLTMRFVARNTQLTPGQELYTEGSGGLFIRGLKIGTVLERHDSAADLLSEVLVEPAVNPMQLETVFILTEDTPKKE